MNPLLIPCDYVLPTAIGGKELETHIRHCMLYEYRRGTNASEAMRNICAVYPGAVSVRKCQRWFNKFSKGNCSLIDESRPGRPKKHNKEDPSIKIEKSRQPSKQDSKETFQVPEIPSLPPQQPHIHHQQPQHLQQYHHLQQPLLHHHHHPLPSQIPLQIQHHHHLPSQQDHLEQKS